MPAQANSYLQFQLYSIGLICYSLASSQNPASRQAKTREQVVCMPSRKQVHPPICSQCSPRSRAACLKTGASETLVTFVPAFGIGLLSSLVQLDNNNTLTSNTARIKIVFFTIRSPLCCRWILLANKVDSGTNTNL